MPQVWDLLHSSVSQTKAFRDNETGASCRDKAGLQSNTSFDGFCVTTEVVSLSSVHLTFFNSLKQSATVRLVLKRFLEQRYRRHRNHHHAQHSTSHPKVTEPLASTSVLFSSQSYKARRTERGASDPNTEYASCLPEQVRQPCQIFIKVSKIARPEASRGHIRVKWQAGIAGCCEAVFCAGGEDQGGQEYAEYARNTEVSINRQKPAEDTNSNNYTDSLSADSAQEVDRSASR